MADVVMPQLGETVSEGTLTRWLKGPGASVNEGDPLFEVSTDKVDTEVAAPVTGELTEILVEAGQTVPVGARLAIITGGKDGRRQLTPLVRRMLAEHDLTAGEVTGTGQNGRIMRADIKAAVAARQTSPALPTPAPAEPKTTSTAPPTVVTKAEFTSTAPPTARPEAPPTDASKAGSAVASAARREAPRDAQDAVTRVPFSAIRRRTAEHMVRSKAISPHTLMAIEVDYNAVDAVRAPERRAWRDREGFSLTYLPFIARAVIDALADHPHLNATVGDDELLVRSQVHLGVAVDLDADGLVVPVIRDAGERRLRGIARAVHDLAGRARGRTLGADDLAGGTFTLSNPGPYGTLLTGAIINQPQVAILATDAVRPRPVALPQPGGGHAIAVHPVGNLALSFDHRAVDGGYAARFLARTKEILEHRAWSDEL